ncbi:MAG: YidC/Oxa1 family membrane protein insertase [Clostridia bacterium]|nr:YidC/Oxa1 family membrane protein insertase [Clostridia bacterium]MBQ6858345.1 YidC/Oxa1 family membrane protein insertase [Clostridia bacterium]
MNFLNPLLLALIKGLQVVINNYAITIIVFTVLIKLLIMPLNLKSRRSTMRMSSVQPQMKALQEKYKDDQEKLNQKLQELYRKEGVSPMGGCLPMILSMFVLFAMFYAMRTFANEQLVTQFLTFYHHPEIDPTTLADSFLWIRNLWMPDSPFATSLPDLQSMQMIEFEVWNDVSAKLAASGVIPQALEFANRDAMMTYINETVAPFMASDVYAPYVAPITGLGNMNILGIIRFSIYKFGNGWFVLPILSILSQLFMQKLTMKQQQMDMSQQGSQKMMLYMMTFMSLYFCAIYNSAFALYWVVSNIYAIVEQVMFDKYFKAQDRKSAKAEEVGI